MECTVSSAATTWSCQISLRHDYASDGTKLSPRPVYFGPLLTEKSDVEIWIRRAQTAVLSPHVHPSQFHDKEIQELRDAPKTDPKILKFSKNVVVVKIYDPNAVDLQFVDLPGVFHVPSPW
jgi:vacuolar protein sorting-associated protein 1